MYCKLCLCSDVTLVMILSVNGLATLNTCEISIIVIPMLQTGKLRFTEMKWPAQDHMAKKPCDPRLVPESDYRACTL